MSRNLRRSSVAILLVASLVLAIALVGGCGQAPTAAPKAAAPTAAPAAPAPAAPAAPTAAPAAPAAAAPATKYKALTARIGHTGETESLLEQDAQDFAKLVGERSGGAIQIKTYPSSQLGKQQELDQQVQLGSLEMGIPSSDMVSIVGEYSIFDMPSIFKDRVQVKKAVEGPLGQELTALAAKKNMVVLGYWENGFRVMTNNKTPIKTPADLKGLKIRVPPNDVRVKMFKLWGANAGPLSFSEVFSALQTGVFDGQENPYAQITSAKFYEVQKYLSETNHVYTPTYLAASPKWFNGLDDATKKLLMDTAKEVGDRSRARGAKMDEEGRKLVESKGMKVNTDVDTKAFKEAAQPLFDDFTKKYGAEGKKLIDLLNQATQ